MIGDKLKGEIRRLYLSFDSANSYYEKGFIWSFLTIAHELFSDIEIENMFQEISMKCLKEEKAFLEDQKIRQKAINKFMKENKKFFHTNILRVSGMEKTSNINLPTKNYNYLIGFLETFLKSLSPDFYAFYKKMVSEERIIMGNNNQTSFSSIKEAKTFIFLEKFNNLRDVMVLVHELGHTYYYQLNNETLSDRALLENSIKDEIPAKMVELMFINYLDAKDFFKSYWILKREFDYDLYMSDQNRSDFDMMKYVIGSLLAYQLNGRYKIEDYFHHVYEHDFHDLITEARSEYINENKGKVLKK